MFSCQKIIIVVDKKREKGREGNEEKKENRERGYIYQHISTNMVTNQYTSVKKKEFYNPSQMS